MATAKERRQRANPQKTLQTMTNSELLRALNEMHNQIHQATQNINAIMAEMERRESNDK